MHRGMKGSKDNVRTYDNPPFFFFPFLFVDPGGGFLAIADFSFCHGGYGYGDKNDRYLHAFSLMEAGEE